jgi:5-methylcytosine-specific restriction endonuclease McrA
MNRVLLLNLDYEPLNICDLPRAIKLIINGKAETLHYKDHKYFYSGNGDKHSVPSVIRLKHNVRRKHNTSFKVSRGGIYGRDNYTCQYCGVKNIDLTLDHVYPRHLGGTHTWDNLVTCCRSCNIKKAGKTLEKSGMRLLSKPKLPIYSFYSILCSSREKDGDYWEYYLVT